MPRSGDKLREVMEREQLWRTVALAYYEAAGAPALSHARPTVARMREIFHGGAPITAGAAERMIEIARYVAGELKGSPETNPVFTVDAPPQMRSGGREHDDERFSAALLATLRTQHPGISLDAVLLQALVQQMRSSSPTRPASAARRRVDRASPPPDPSAAGGAVAFMAKVRELRDWSGLSFAALEAEAKAQGAWLPHSTLADALARDTPLSGSLLDALTLVCDLDPAQRASWELARRRACSELPATQSPDPGGSHAEDAGEPEPERTVVLRTPRRLMRARGKAAVR